MLVQQTSHKDYSPLAQKPDLDSEAFNIKVEQHMKNLSKTKEERYS